MIVNARKRMFDRYYCIKVLKIQFSGVHTCITLALFVLIFLYHRMQIISIDILVPGPSDINTSYRKQLLNHGLKLARIHNMVGEFTKCSGCLPFILIVDKLYIFTFCWQDWLCSTF